MGYRHSKIIKHLLHTIKRMNENKNNNKCNNKNKTTSRVDQTFDLKQISQTSTTILLKKSSTSSINSSINIPKYLLRHKKIPLGLANLGNTCYANSVIQALFQCTQFRHKCIRELSSSVHDGVLHNISKLFLQLSLPYNPNRKYIVPLRFILVLRRQNYIFQTPEQHDAHEFFSYLLNSVGDELRKKKLKKKKKVRSPLYPIVTRYRNHIGHAVNNLNKHFTAKYILGETWLHDIFQGILVCTVRCMACNAISLREEPFFDVPLDVNLRESDLLMLLVNFTQTEILNGKNKYICDNCCSLQDAERKLSFLKLPQILTIHLKRFDFNHLQKNYIRAAYRVDFPTEFIFPKSAISNLSINYNTNVIYNLVGIVIHVGKTLSCGHYITCVQRNKEWWIIDDHIVKPIVESYLKVFFGSNGHLDESACCSYLLLYESQNLSKPKI